MNDSFWLFYGLQSLNGRNSSSNIFYGLFFQGVLVFVIEVFVFEITKTKTPKFVVKFDLKLGGKNRTEDNLTDQTYFDYNLTSYFDGFDFRGSYFLSQVLGLRSQFSRVLVFVTPRSFECLPSTFCVHFFFLKKKRKKKNRHWPTSNALLCMTRQLATVLRQSFLSQWFFFYHSYIQPK